ncbi:putative uncharacterized protein DDB_G0282129 [Mercenaria mercenaria]|uniref:putative uncharacterized protein DDB_G0282129 n=1 Tax=Mercenaria mercenaria TaxID=6596 RepID=UPI00234F3572|nr:putative uncharacterized protein DDB_G0282129 [Mercenaria mercenaria]
MAAVRRLIDEDTSSLDNFEILFTMLYRLLQLFYNQLFPEKSSNGVPRRVHLKSLKSSFEGPTTPDIMDISSGSCRQISGTTSTATVRINRLNPALSNVSKQQASQPTPQQQQQEQQPNIQQQDQNQQQQQQQKIQALNQFRSV